MYLNIIYYIGEEHVDSVPKRPRTDIEGLDEVSYQSTIQRKRPHDVIGMSVLRNIILFYIFIWNHNYAIDVMFRTWTNQVTHKFQSYTTCLSKIW